MKTRTVVEYEQEDFDSVKNNMTTEQATEILKSLPRGWFPYRLPEWGSEVGTSDYENYSVCCAIDVALQALKEVQNRD